MMANPCVKELGHMIGDTRQRLLERAADENIKIATWSPGDGQTRYRFIDCFGLAQSDNGGELDYFGTSGERTLYTALGLAEAWVFLRGFIAAQNAEMRHGYIQRSMARREAANDAE